MRKPRWWRQLDRLLGEAETPSINLPDFQKVRLRTGVDQDQVSLYGVMYQRCGGGRRVIRRQKEV